MKNRKRLLVTIAIGVVLIVAFYFASGYITRMTGFSVNGNNITKNGIADSSSISQDSSQDNGFTECLKKQDIKLYISDSSEQSLKNTGLFDYLQYFKIQDCSVNNNGCPALLPSWSINGKQVDGRISLSDLKKYAGC